MARNLPSPLENEAAVGSFANSGTRDGPFKPETNVKA